MSVIREVPLPAMPSTGSGWVTVDLSGGQTIEEEECFGSAARLGAPGQFLSWYAPAQIESTFSA